MTLSPFPDAAPIAGLAGGILIGLAAAVMLVGVGRIAGVSGLAARAFGLSESGPPRSTAWAFLIGLPLGVFIIALANGGVEARFTGFGPILLAGLLVGLGTRIGSGCTSGHGVCGVSRLSQRSIVATVTFMAAGIITVAVMNLFGWKVL